MTFENWPDVMSVDEVRLATGIGKNAIYEYVKTGELKSLRIGRKIRIPKICLIDFLTEKCDTSIHSNGKQIVLSRMEV